MTVTLPPVSFRRRGSVISFYWVNNFMKQKQIIWIAAFFFTSGLAVAQCQSPSEMTVTPTPAVTGIEGTIESVETGGPAPFIRVSTADGQTETVDLDINSTRVWKGKERVSISQLKTGDTIRMRYVVTPSGDLLAKTIDIVQPDSK